jgi:hypothetical protein
MLPGFLQGLEVNLFHLVQGRRHPLCFLRVFVLHQIAQNGGDDLPRYAIAVFEPAAGYFFSARGEFLPQFINFLLRPAVHEERNG